MTSEFTRHHGLSHKVFKAGDEAGMTAELWNALAENPTKFALLPAIIQDRVAVTIKSRLSAPTTVTFPAASAPQRLADRKDVQLFGRALELFGSVNKKSPAMPEHTVERRDLEDGLNDFELIDEHGGEDAVVFASFEKLDDVVARLVGAQPGGAPGHLLSDGRANIFFVRDPENPARVLYVNVSWGGDGREWRVSGHPADANRWDRGRRVFRDATVA